MATSKNMTKKQLVEELEQNYILLRACTKLGLARSTVYRWMKEDESFEESVHYAQKLGRRNMSDFIETKLIANIEDGNQRAIEYWLGHHNDDYRSKEVSVVGTGEQLP